MMFRVLPLPLFKVVSITVCTLNCKNQDEMKEEEEEARKKVKTKYMF